MQHKLSQKPNECEGMDGRRMVCVHGGSMECETQGTQGQVRQKKFSHARDRIIRKK